MSTVKHNSSHRQELPGEGSRFSIAGMLIFTAVVAVHVALGKWDIGWIVLLAPFSLSIVAIEILRRMFCLPIVRAMVIGIVTSAICYASIVGGMAIWKRWSYVHGPYWNHSGRYLQPPTFGDYLGTGMRASYMPFAWYLVAGMIVMIGYCGVILLRDSQSKRVVKSRLLQRGDAVETANIEIDDK